MFTTVLSTADLLQHRNGHLALFRPDHLQGLQRVKRLPGAELALRNTQSLGQQRVLAARAFLLFVTTGFEEFELFSATAAFFLAGTISKKQNKILRLSFPPP